MKSFIHKTLPSALIACAIMLIGCDVPTTSLVESDGDLGVDVYSESFASDDLTTILTEELELSSTQQASLRVEIQRHERPEKTPGSLWFVSTRLQNYLSARQKEKLFSIAHRLRADHLRKLVGVYGPCVFDQPVDDERSEIVPIRLIIDVLTEEQLDAVEDVHARVRQQIANLRERARRGELARPEAARLIQQLHDTLADEIRALLSSDQIAALRERIAARGDEPEVHVQHNRRAMIAALGLAESQIAALDQLHLEQCGGLKQVVRLVRSGQISRAEFRAALDRLVAGKVEAYERIMDREQFEIAKIHDALLVINARRFVHHLTDNHDDDTQRPDPARDASSE